MEKLIKNTKRSNSSQRIIVNRNYIIWVYFIVIAIIWVCFWLLADEERLTRNGTSKRFYYRKKDNQNGIPTAIVPNIVHYILLKEHFISFAHYISIISVIRNHKPDQIIIHCDCDDLEGEYWERIKLERFNIKVRKIEIPDTIFGRKLSAKYKLWHASDILRNQILLQLGGIYLDRDVYVVKSLDKFRSYEMTAGIEQNYYKKKLFGNMIQIANKNARFLRKYYQSYQNYDPNQWYYNAGYLPTEIIKEDPKSINLIESELGTNSYEVLPILYLQNSKSWQNRFFSFHFLMRNNSLQSTSWWYRYNQIQLTQYNETNIKQLNTTFGQMARFIFYNTTQFVN